jgi:septal ring factor EnvC (AmiA/AmiB activator)
MSKIRNKKPLRLLCPHCGKLGHHPVVKTDPNTYYCGDQSTAIFVRIAGRDISYRMREKWCIHCQCSFVSVEMAVIYLKSMVTEIQRQETALRQAVVENEYLSAELAVRNDERAQLRTTIEKLEVERASLHAEAEHLREGLQRLADTALELGCRRLRVTTGD